MRGVAALVLMLGCGGDPEIPARLEELGDVPQNGQDLPAAFDFDGSLILIDSNTGLRRFADGRLLTVTGGGGINFGVICVDRDGTLLIGNSNFLQLQRLEPGDQLIDITPQPPTSFTRCTATPNGAYHIQPFGAATTLMLARDGEAWFDSMRTLDRTQRAPDGTIYAVENGDIVRLAADDSPQVVASCAEFAGGTCPNLEFAGVDGAGHVHVAIKGLPDLHVLDPSTGGYRDIALPGGLEIEAVATGPLNTLVLATDPERQDARSLWLLPEGGDQLLRFASLTSSPLQSVFVRILADRAGTLHVIENGKLSRVVPL
jgi:hypothetical protein